MAASCDGINVPAAAWLLALINAILEKATRDAPSAPDDGSSSSSVFENRAETSVALPVPPEGCTLNVSPPAGSFEWHSPSIVTGEAGVSA